MEEFAKIRFCYGCLSRNEENSLQTYRVENKHLKSIFQVDTLCLCIFCKRVVKKAEHLIKNVQSNQILLENFHNGINSSLQTDRLQVQPVVNLTSVSLLYNTAFTGDDKTVDETLIVVENCNITKDIKIKVELDLKQEENDSIEHLEAEFVDDDEFQGSFVKEENDFPLKELLKEEIDIENENIDQLLGLKKSLKKNKIKKKGKTNKTKTSKDNRVANNVPDHPKARTVYITREECMREREDMLKDNKYINSTYKCPDCIKGFMFKASFERHMERHSVENGDYSCDICKQLFWSEEKLTNHKRYHTTRYKCSVCDLTRISRHTILDHYSAIHCYGYFQYNCPHCPKVFVRKISLRKHICYAHTNKERVVCGYCHKSYANKEVLKSHMIMKHPKNVGAVELSKRHVCQVCMKAFKAPSHLKKHSIKHSEERQHYCVECDKSFKSDSILKHHLKTASPHVNYLELPLPCLHCDKRFAIRRDLERHTNRVHLNIRPHQCDKCDKAYVNGWSLNEHKRIVHEGYKRPLRFPCTYCDKVFDRNQILKGHLRTHTGERPFQCSKCPAQFSQASVLGTHVKLIHLKLTRDGKPKTNNVH